jgi:hypothetical protein
MGSGKRGKKLHLVWPAERRPADESPVETNVGHCRRFLFERHELVRFFPQYRRVWLGRKTRLGA